METILVPCNEPENLIEGVEHLKNNKELYWSVAFPINGNNFNFPIRVLFHLSGDQVRYEGRADRIERYEISHHENSKIKPLRWMNISADRNYKASIVLTSLIPNDIETNSFTGRNGNPIRATQGFQYIDWTRSQ